MGLLEDAIRQHLELKRRHGASEQEVLQKEAEALGPPRREASVSAPEGAEEGVPEEAVSEPAADEPGMPFDREVPAEPAGGAPPTEAMPAPSPQVEDVDVAKEEAPLEVEGAAPEPALEETAFEEPELPDPAFDEPGPEEAALGTPAVEEEAAVEDEATEPGADAGEPDEDVLEETPDFLQETPEHDRLWFEQKPPRDFDFD